MQVESLDDETVLPPTRGIVFQILSPHPDDAAVSLGHTLLALADAGAETRIITCFSRSAWAPKLTERNLEAVTAVRRIEDRRFAASLGCELLDLGGTDAPFRGHYPGRFAFLHERAFDGSEFRVLSWLIAHLEDLLEDGPILLPLAFGGHIDHRLVRAAGRAVASKRPLALYEDLPYVQGRMTSQVDDAAMEVDDTLQPCLVPAGSDETRLAAGMRMYASQFDDDQVESFLAHGRARGGERLLASQPFADVLKRTLQTDSR